MRKVLAIIKREYLVRARTRWFLIGTIITPLMLLGSILFPIIFATSGSQSHIVILDQSGDPGLFEAIKKRMAADQSFSINSSDEAFAQSIPSQIVVPSDKDIDEVRRELIQKDSNSAYILLRAGVFDGKEFEYYAKNVSDFSLERLRRLISSAIIERRLVRAGLNPEQVNQYMRPVEMKTFKIGSKGETEEKGGAVWIAFVMLFFIYVTLITYGISVMRGVIEEKQSRIVEVLISSARPFQMMLGKLIGIGLVGLTQYMIWVASVLMLLGISFFAGRKLDLPTLPISLLAYFIIYFLLGYFLFATLYAMVGSMVSSEEDAQQLQMPLTMLNVVPVTIFWLVVRDPNSAIATMLSMVPFFAPTLMMARIAIGPPPFWQILLSMLLMLASILGATWVAGRIYRVGILMYGKRPSIAELGRWLRYT
jgi:ABC-2 type transport system permease protein